MKLVFSKSSTKGNKYKWPLIPRGIAVLFKSLKGKQFLIMEYIIATTENSNFKIEYELNEQVGALPLPFSGMDKSTSAVCNFFNLGEY